MQHGLAAFVLIGGQSHVEKAEIFFNAYSRVLRFLDAHERPFIAKVYASGKIGLWLDEETWRQLLSARPLNARPCHSGLSLITGRQAATSRA